MKKANAKAITAKEINKAAKAALKNATKKASAAKKAPKEKEVKAKKEKEVKAPKAKAAAAQSAYDWAVANIKKPSDAAARKLIVGDVIECFYNDDPKPRVEVVICSADKGEDIYDVLTVPQEKWGTRTASLTKVNTDMWRLVGTMKFSVKK
jgi:hypothetical protein